MLSGRARQQLFTFVTATAGALGTVVLFAQGQSAPAPQAQAQAITIKTVKPGAVYFATGGGGNSGIVIGTNGVIVVDAKTTPEAAKQLIAEVAKLTPKPITHVILTHSDGDHVNGLPAFPARIPVIAHVNNRREQWATIMGSVVEVDGGKCIPPREWLPTQLVSGEQVSLKLDGVNLVLYHFAPAHTSGDLVVYLPDDKIAFTGDLITTAVQVHQEKYGSLDGLFTSLRRMLALDVTSYVGGHANEVDTKVTLQQRMADYQAKVDKVNDLMKQGKSLAEVKAAMGDPPRDNPGCRGIPFPQFTEIAYQDNLLKQHAIR